MANPNQIPSARVPFLGEDGTLSLPWRRWAQSLTSSASGSTVTPAEFQALSDLVTVVQANAATALATAQSAALVAEAAELLSLVDLSSQDITSGPSAASLAGFGFFAGGTMTDSELLGTAVWGYPRVFSGTPQDTAQALYGSSLDSKIGIYAYPGGSRSLVGSVEFNRSTTGTVSWSAPLSLAAGAALEISAPSPPDPSLASVRVMIYGV